MEIDDSQVLSPKQRKVLNIFREFLMSAGDMLCFCGKDLDDYRTALEQLRALGFLKAERMKGAFSLTREGSVAMRDTRVAAEKTKRPRKALAARAR